MDSTTAKFPLLFGFHAAIVGQGFLAGVRASGRAIAERERADDWWILGVHPGAIAEHGSTLQDAVSRFRLRLKAVLIDFAEETADFAAFKREVESFFIATEPESEREWEMARQAVRAGKLSLAELPKVTDCPPPRIEVTILDLVPDANVLDDQPSSLAA